MIHRPLIHVGGPPGAGKTTFIEAMLAAHDEEAFIVVRARRDTSLRAPRATSRVGDVERDPELRRYLNADAMTAVGYAFGSASVDDLFMSEFMQEYSTAVVIEGDDPTGLADLNVHVMSASADPVLAARQEQQGAPVDPNSALLALLADAGISAERARLRIADDARRLGVDEAAPVRARGAGRRATNPGAPALRWTISETHHGIAWAQLVVVTLRGDDERELGDALLAEVARLRGDPEVFADVRLRLVGGRIPITAVVADPHQPQGPRHPQGARPGPPYPAFRVVAGARAADA